MEVLHAEAKLQVPAKAPPEQTAIFVDKINGQWKKTKLTPLDIDKISTIDTVVLSLPGLTSLQRCENGLEYDTTLIFLTNRLEDDNVPGGDEVNEKMRLALSRLCAIPGVFWGTPESRIQGFFGCDERHEKNKLHEHKSWFRFMIKQLKKSEYPTKPLDPKNFEWCRVMCFTRWLSSGQSMLLCMPLQRPVRKHIWQAIEDAHGPNRLRDPFWMHLAILRLIIVLWDEAIWHLQPLVKGVEASNEGAIPISALYNAAAPKAEFPKLHEILRYALHHAECSKVAVDAVEGMRDHYKHLLSRMDEHDSEQMQVSTETLNKLNYELQLLSSLQTRAAAYRDRMSNEITLTFHNVSQYDTWLSLEMGKQQLLDSATMRVIAFLTLTCLPFTLVCAIFGTPFFSFSPQWEGHEERFDVSKRFWILWAIGIPITVVTVLFYSKMGSGERKTGHDLDQQKPKTPSSISQV